MMDKLISIIIPIYNGERFISSMIQSLLSQTYQNFEVIMINDGSTDHCQTILDTIEDARFHIIHQNNQGVSITRNTGLDLAKGSFIAFVDIDDSITSTYLADLIEAMEKGYDLVICGYSTINELGKELYHFPQEGTLARSISHTEFLTDILDPYLYKSTLWNKLYRRELIGMQRFDPTITIGEDLLFLEEYVSKCKELYFIPNCNYSYLKNTQGAMQSIQKQTIYNPKWNSEWEAIKIYEKHVGKLSNLLMKKVIIAEKLVKKAICLEYTDSSIQEMKQFLCTNKKNILLDSNINWKWKIHLFKFILSIRRK